MKRIILVAILITLSLFGYSQTDFREGYYINLTNDTIKGLIDFRGDIKNANFCMFKKNGTSEVTTYKPQDIKAYRFLEDKYYISQLVKIDNEEKLIFLEFLLDGTVDLFYHRNKNGESFYFIEDKEGRFVVFHEKVNNESTGNVDILGTNKQIGLLKAVFSDCMEIQDEIDKTLFNHKSLINITKSYHDYVCEGEKCIIYEKKKSNIKIRILPTVGVAISYIQINYDLLSSFDTLKFDKHTSPSAGFFFNISSDRINEKLALEIGVTFTQNEFNTFSQEEYFASWLGFYDNYVYKTTYDFNIQTTLLQTSIGLKYTYPKRKVRPTIAIGGILNYSLSNNSHLATERIVNPDALTALTDYSTRNDYFLDQNLFGTYVQLGINFDFFKKVLFFSNFKYSRIVEQYETFGTIMYSYSLDIGLNF